MRVFPTFLAAFIVSVAAYETVPTDFDDQQAPPETDTQDLADNIATLAYESADMSLPMLSSGAVSNSSGTANYSMTVAGSTECPRGGVLGVQGRVSGRYDPATHTRTSALEGTAQATECIVHVGDRELVLNGDPHLSVRA